MANNIKLVTYAGSTVTPQDDALVYEMAVGQNGIISGCAITLKNNNTLHISAGHGIVCGRKFSIVESDITVLLTTGDTQSGRVYIHLDLSNTTDPIQILTETGSLLTEPIQQEDVNISNGIYEFNLATFTIDALTIADLVDVKPNVEKLTDKLENAKVDTLITMEEVEATTDNATPVGAGAIKQLNENLVAEDNLKFQFATDGEGNYGYLGADDSFIPFSNISNINVLLYCVIDKTNLTITVPDETQFVLVLDGNTNTSQNIIKEISNTYSLKSVGESIEFVDEKGVSDVVLWETKTSLRITRSSTTGAITILACSS